MHFHRTSEHSLPLWHYLVLIDMNIRLQISYRQHLNIYPSEDWMKVPLNTVLWNYTNVLNCLLISYLCPDQIRILNSSRVCHKANVCCRAVSKYSFSSLTTFTLYVYVYIYKWNVYIYIYIYIYMYIIYMYIFINICVYIHTYIYVHI